MARLIKTPTGGGMVGGFEPKVLEGLRGGRVVRPACGRLAKYPVDAVSEFCRINSGGLQCDEAGDLAPRRCAHDRPREIPSAACTAPSVSIISPPAWINPSTPAAFSPASCAFGRPAR